MSRWSIPDNGAHARSVHSESGWLSYGLERQYAETFVRAHNEDCDAYEGRIAELEAELKSESEWVAIYKQEREDALAERDAIVRAVQENGASLCCCEYNAMEEILVQCEHCDFVERVSAIAEGREGLSTELHGMARKEGGNHG